MSLLSVIVRDIKWHMLVDYEPQMTAVLLGFSCSFLWHLRLHQVLAWLKGTTSSTTHGTCHSHDRRLPRRNCKFNIFWRCDFCNVASFCYCTENAPCLKMSLRRFQSTCIKKIINISWTSLMNSLIKSIITQHISTNSRFYLCKKNKKVKKHFLWIWWWFNSTINYTFAHF